MKTLLAKLSLWSVGVVALAALAILALGDHDRAGASTFAAYRPVLILLVVAIAAIVSVVATTIASPIGRLSETMERFGAGDLSARVKSDRRDEIGTVGRNFDRMADRIETLVTAERRLIQDVSHELRAPLARLRFAAELVRTADDPAAAVDRLNREIDRLSELVGSLMQVTRAEGDPASYRPAPLSLDGLVREIVDGCGAQPDRIDLQVERGISVLGDRELLRRAIENVVNNGLQHGKVGPVQIRVAAHDGAAQLTVRDVGPGVPDQDLAEIFKPFYRVDAARDRAHGGVGLGLAIAQRAVSLHGGRIRAENAHPGLRVTMTLPLDASAADRP